MTVEEPVSLKRRAFSAGLVTVLGQAVSQALRLAGNMILTRLLFPEAFGVMAIVVVVMQAVELTSSFGVGPAIVRHAKGDDPLFLDTGFTIQATRGIALFVVSALLAAPVAYFYEEPSLIGFIIVTGLTAPMRGFESTKLLGLVRQMSVVRLTIVEMAAQVAALVATVALAYLLRNVWALVAGHLVSAVVRLILSHLYIPGRNNRFRYDRALAKEILGFGKWIFVSTLFAFFAMKLDIMILGKLLDMATTGVYNTGMMVTAVLSQISSKVTEIVVLPALAKTVHEGPERFREAFKRSRRLVLAAALLGFAGGGVVSPLFFDVAYDFRYEAAGWIAQLSMVGLWFSFLHESSGRALLASGQSRPWAMSMIVKTVVTLVGCLVGFSLDGLVGLMIGAATGSAAAYLVTLHSLRQQGVSGFDVDVRFTLLGLFLTGIIWLGPRWLCSAAPSIPPSYATMIIGSIALAPYSGWVLTTLRRELKDR